MSFKKINIVIKEAVPKQIANLFTIILMKRLLQELV